MLAKDELLGWKRTETEGRSGCEGSCVGKSSRSLGSDGDAMIKGEQGGEALPSNSRASLGRTPWVIDSGEWML